MRSSDHLPALYCDAGRVRQLLTNPLGNAIKFTPKRGTSTLEAEGGGMGGIVISFSDKGLGIPKEELDGLFEPYSRIKVHGVARTRQGSGLGLSLVRILADQHQASLEVESVENHGTKVSVRLPPTWVKRIV
ncbi:MAG: ATP-binding protein [Rhodospirillaceae bacterium]